MLFKNDYFINGLRCGLALVNGLNFFGSLMGDYIFNGNVIV